MARPGMRSTRVLRVTPSGHGPDDAAAIAEAAALLRAGELVAFPTETVYGLGADATSTRAVEGIFTAKERPRSDPLIVHLAAAEELGRVARGVPELAGRLAARFWPGPLTLILPRTETIPPIVAAGGPTVGVRVPAHPVARALIAAAGVPVAAPSANRFMHTSPTTAAHVLADLDGRIDCVLDAGPCAVGVESTVLDVTVTPPRILRPGGVTLEALRTVAPEIAGPIEAPTLDAGSVGASGGRLPGAHSASPSPARAPGQMARHYAPRTRLVVFDAQGVRGLAAVRGEVLAARARGERVGALLPDDEARVLEGEHPGVAVAALGPAGDLAVHTRRLYAALRELDALGLDLIVAHTFSREGLGLALADRLRRAAGGQLQPVAQ
ncbi:MAG TPA: L-threonylcarbamoyladenylate synthase [Ktedonobacterales bacterium]